MRVSRLTMHNRKDFILTAESAKGAKDFKVYGLPCRIKSFAPSALFAVKIKYQMRHATYILFILKNFHKSSLLPYIILIYNRTSEIFRDIS